MTDLSLIQSSFSKAIWTGRLQRGAAGPAPKLQASFNGTTPVAIEMSAAPGVAHAWNVSLRVPEDGLSEGTHLILIETEDTQEVLYRIPIIAGVAATEDMRAEIAALRAELDQLKSAFRTAMRLRSAN